MSLTRNSKDYKLNKKRLKASASSRKNITKTNQ